LFIGDVFYLYRSRCKNTKIFISYAIQKFFFEKKRRKGYENSCSGIYFNNTTRYRFQAPTTWPMKTVWQ